MKYKIIKKRVGTNKLSTFATFETKGEIIDTTFVDSEGMLFIEKGSPCIGLINLKGHVKRDWIGKEGDARYQNGSQDIARFKSPCSICNNGTFVFVLEENGFVIRKIGLKYKYVENLSGNMYKEELEKKLSKKKMSPLIKSSASGKNIVFVNSVSNRCFCLKGSKLESVIGDGKKRFSVSSDYSMSSFNNPSGVYVTGNIIYVADTKNHCIRKIDRHKKTVHVVVGNPLATQDKDLGHPSKLVVKKNMVFMLDGDKIRVTGINSFGIDTIHQSDNVESFEVDNKRNIFILERNSQLPTTEVVSL